MYRYVPKDYDLILHTPMPRISKDPQGACAKGRLTVESLRGLEFGERFAVDVG